MKQSLQNRILSFFMAMVMTCGSLVFPVHSVEAMEQSAAADNSGQVLYDPSLKILQNGVPVLNMSINDHEKVEVFAEGVETATGYQWQVLHPEQEGLWVNVLDGTQQSIGVSAALVGSVMSADGSAQLRCLAYTADGTYQTEPLTVRIRNEEAGNQMLLAASYGAVPQSDDSSAPELTEFVTVTVNYIRYDYKEGTQEWQPEGVLAFAPYVATMLYNGPLGNPSTQTGLTIQIPSMVGYECFLANKDGEPDFTDQNIDGVQINRENGKATSISIKYQENLTKNIEFTIHYLPAKVGYSVHYFFQNIYDDNYMEDVSKTVVSTGRTGSYPDQTLVQREYDGFTALYYEPAAIAADGSTVFEVYYERNYYLMDFDCNGGYGVAPVYMRYESYITVPQPRYAGWSFQGWDMTRAWDDAENALKVEMDTSGKLQTIQSGGVAFNDGVSDDLPLTMPLFNTSYKALWSVADTTYTVAYWIKDPDGDNHTFLDSVTYSAQTDTVIYPTGAYANMLCGKDRHQHTEACYACGMQEHTHHLGHTLQTCYQYAQFQGVAGTDDQKVMEATNKTASSQNQSPQNGDIYFIYNPSTDIDRYWPKMYLNGQYYTITINGEQAPSVSECLTYVEGAQIGEEGSAGNLKAVRYRAKVDCVSTSCAPDCSIEVHSHNSSGCGYGCGKELHTHVKACYPSSSSQAPYVLYDREYTERQNASLTVAGDGSTTLNEYYNYKTYEIRFLFARSFMSSGAPIYQVSTNTNDGSRPNATWTNVSALPTVRENPQGGTDYRTYQEDGYTYYYIYLQAQYRADIYDLWPAANIENMGTQIWGSWATENGTPYRDAVASNANITGKYPALSAEMIRYDQVPLTDLDRNGNPVFLAQMMNAWWGNNGMSIQSHSYHNYMEVLKIPEQLQTMGLANVSQDGRNPTAVESDSGTEYYIVQSYENGQGQTAYKCYRLMNDLFVANHDENTKVAPAEFAGFTVRDRANHENRLARDFSNVNRETGQIGCEVCAPNNCRYCNIYLYDRTIHRIKFWSVNKYIGDGQGSPVAYGTSLQAHGAYFDIGGQIDMNSDTYYPSIYEKGAYIFDGWYTTPNFVEGTRMDWSQTMPDADFTVYAKWTPVTHKAYFYEDYDALVAGNLLQLKDTNGNTHSNPVDVTHAEPLPFAVQIPTKEGYKFLGWFYMDGTEKKRFSPETMGFKQDMYLFAEWYHNEELAVEYEVRYCMTDGTEIAPATTGHSSAGRTRTFQAKGGDALDAPYHTGYFPKTSSHSILMKEGDPNPNQYTFQYVYDEQVRYRIVFLNIADKTVLHPEIEKTTNQAVVTERYVPISGFIPLPGYFYQTKSLCSDDDQNGNIHPENVITFYYIEDTEHDIYSIEYYQADLDSTNYSLKTSFTNTADLKVNGQSNSINSSDEFELMTFDGFTLDYIEVIQYTVDQNGYVQERVERTNANLTDPNFSVEGVLDGHGLAIKLYYSRNRINYTIKYVDNESGDVLHTEASEGWFGQVVSATAPQSYSYGGRTYQYYQKDTTAEQRTKRLTLRASGSNGQSAVNELVFYYLKPTVTIYYRAVCSVPDSTGFGGVTYNSETIAAGAPTGSTAIAAYGFTFEGWYLDEECTQRATNDDGYLNPKFVPAQWPTSGDSATYYALFTPQFTDMTIDVTGLGTTGDEDYAMIRIKGTGKTAYVDILVAFDSDDKIMLEQLPMGVYTVSLLTAWSWTYDAPTIACTAAYENGVVGKPHISEFSVILETKEREGTNLINCITFTCSQKDVDWLYGEAGQNINPSN